jgi:hypothetical protein
VPSGKELQPSDLNGFSVLAAAEQIVIINNITNFSLMIKIYLSIGETANGIGFDFSVFRHN